MSNTDIRVVPGPANYYSHAGSLARLHDFYSAEQLSRAVWIYGERAFAGAKAFLPEGFNAPVRSIFCLKATVASTMLASWLSKRGMTVQW